MKKNILKTSYALTVIILLSACAPTAKSLFPMKEGEAISIIKVDVNMDGRAEGAFGANCNMGFSDAEAKGSITAVRDTDTHYYIMKSQAGPVNVSGLACLSYQVFYNKLRTYKLDGLSFEAKEGSINYVGDLNVDWETSRFNVGDIIGVGGFEVGGGNEGVLQMKALSNADGAKKFLKDQQLPVEGVPFRTTSLSDHKLLTK